MISSSPVIVIRRIVRLRHVVFMMLSSFIACLAEFCEIDFSGSNNHCHTSLQDEDEDVDEGENSVIDLRQPSLIFGGHW